MLTNLLYLLPAILGLSVLIFFHELGHYYMARRVGMRVEVFAIGFGRPIYSWMFQGVKWQIGWLPFGGYVKIYGQDADDKRDPYEISDGFFGKRPIDRIKVALAGPLVNILLALVFFAIIWALGGREKSFSEYTHKIGWVDPKSDLYADGIRPGDEIVSYNQMPYQTFKDNLYAPMISSEGLSMEGLKVNYASGTEEKKPFTFQIKPYPHPLAMEKDRLTSGVLSSANYLLYDKSPDRSDNPLPSGSPMQNSGITYGDRIVWMDGHLIFSAQELSQLLNDKRALLTILRNGKTQLVRVPRLAVQDIRLDPAFKEELADWQYESGLNGIKLQKLYTIPYNLTHDAIVESEVKLIDKDHELQVFPPQAYSAAEEPLQKGDRIVAVNGKKISVSHELLKELQQPAVNIIVERVSTPRLKPSWPNEDDSFDQELNVKDIQKIATSIGTDHPVQTSGKYVLLNPVTPKPRLDFNIPEEQKVQLLSEYVEQKKEIEQIEDPEKRNRLLELLKAQENLLVLGVPIQDLHIEYNPGPLTQFKNVFTEIKLTLVALLSGDLNPKWMSGPIGIVQVVRDNWILGIKDAFFWLGAISLNLGILNLLPIPVLDGGTIVLSLFEMISGVRLKQKTLERLVLPFALLLIGFFIFITYQDLSRIFHFIRW